VFACLDPFLELATVLFSARMLCSSKGGVPLRDNHERTKAGRDPKPQSTAIDCLPFSVPSGWEAGRYHWHQSTAILVGFGLCDEAAAPPGRYQRHHSTGYGDFLRVGHLLVFWNVEFPTTTAARLLLWASSVDLPGVCPAIWIAKIGTLMPKHRPLDGPSSLDAGDVFFKRWKKKKRILGFAQKTGSENLEMLSVREQNVK
jgi:hypothetical protein